MDLLKPFRVDAHSMPYHQNKIRDFAYDLMVDCEKFRDTAVDGHGKISNPRLFDRSIRYRLEAVSKLQDLLAILADAEYQAMFYDVVVAKVAEASPEIAQAIMSRLDELHREVVRQEKEHAATAVFPASPETDVTAACNARAVRAFRNRARTRPPESP